MLESQRPSIAFCPVCGDIRCRAEIKWGGGGGCQVRLSSGEKQQQQRVNANLTAELRLNPPMRKPHPAPSSIPTHPPDTVPAVEDTPPSHRGDYLAAIDVMHVGAIVLLASIGVAVSFVRKMEPMGR